MLEGLLLVLDVIAMLVLLRWSARQDEVPESATTVRLAETALHRRRP
jgi:hypothetical protein